MTDARPLIGVILLLSACGQPAQQARREPPAADLSSQRPVRPATPTPELEPKPAFYIGRWATSVSACANQAWTFGDTSLKGPDGDCAFVDVMTVPTGFRMAGTCRWDGVERPADVSLAYAQSAQALLISGTPLGEVGLVACPAGA